jgi:hypothetical protein
MAVRIGMDCKVYRNTATYASPTWNEVTCVKDATLNLERAEADISKRGGSGWRSTVGTLKDATLELVVIADRSITTEKADLDALRDAWLNNTKIELIVLDGPEPAPSGSVASEGIRASWYVATFNRTENLEEGVQYEVTLRVTSTENSSAEVAPAWFTGTVSA